MNIFTDRAKLSLSKAESLALANAHQQLTVEHLLLTLLSNPHDHCAKLVEQSGGDLKNILNELQDELDDLPKVDGPGVKNLTPTAQFQKLILSIKGLSLYL